MRFLIISDMHGEADVFEKLSDEFVRADAVLCAGDFARFGKPETGAPVLDRLAEKHDRVYAVTGNCDDPLFAGTLEERDVSVQGTVVYTDGLFFAGSGGALRFTGVTPNERTDEDLVSDLEPAAAGFEQHAGTDGWNSLILIVHQPPKDTKLDRVSAGAHVGSALVRKFIEETKPLAVISGHIHESFAVDALGPTVLVNPGSLAEGRYAVMEAERRDGVWTVTDMRLHVLTEN